VSGYTKPIKFDWCLKNIQRIRKDFNINVVPRSWSSKIKFKSISSTFQLLWIPLCSILFPLQPFSFHHFNWSSRVVSVECWKVGFPSELLNLIYDFNIIRLIFITRFTMVSNKKSRGRKKYQYHINRNKVNRKSRQLPNINW